MAHHQHWPFSPGQKVQVRPPRDSDDWKADWQGVVFEVVGVKLDPDGSVYVDVSRDWPRDGGFEDWPAEDLMAIEG
jgi:hypothetical protein